MWDDSKREKMGIIMEIRREKAEKQAGGTRPIQIYTMLMTFNPSVQPEF